VTSGPTVASPEGPGSVDRVVIGRGAAFGLLLGAPAAVVNGLLASQEPKPKGALNATFLALVVSFWLAGFMAGREAPSRPVVHGLAAGLATFALVEVIGVLGRLDRGTPVSAGSIVVVAVLALACSAAGAGGGARRPRPYRRDQPAVSDDSTDQPVPGGDK